MNKLKQYLPLLIFTAIIVFFFRSFFLSNLLPIPADDIVGLYHPFRDLYAKDYPNGIPYKNFLITDPIRQQYPWRYLAITLEKQFQLPLWNPYTFSGTPLLANGQSAVFYPLNLLFFLFPFSIAWSIYIFLGQFLGGIFLYYYLRYLRLSKIASLFGSIVYSFSGFFIAWLEWGTLVHTLLWLPVLLLSIDKIFFRFVNAGISNVKYRSYAIAMQRRRQMSNNRKSKTKNKTTKNENMYKKYILWSIIFTFALICSFFAGHLQTFFYVYVITNSYFLVRWFQYSKQKNILFLYLILHTIFLILTSIQWVPMLEFIGLSARNVDQVNWQQEGWFIPWQHMIQFIAPDFFGNPATLNYWGIWNYGEFIGYIGLIPLLMGIYAMFFRHDRKTFFFGTLFFISLLFAFPTVFAKLPYILKVPFLSTSQPTRLLAVTDFSLAILAALGIEYFLLHKRKFFYPLSFFTMIFLSIWFSVIFVHYSHPWLANILIAKHNLILPSIIFVCASCVIVAAQFIKKTSIIIFLIIVLTLFDVMRFADKFIPFTSSSYIYPSTKALTYLQSHIGIQRIMETDKRILPPNFSIMYQLPSIDGYDPLYLLRYGELSAAIERGQPNISAPFGFNRIITSENYNNPLINLFGVKYILSLSELKNPKLKKVFQEGQTRVYENTQVLPRIFFIQRLLETLTKQQAVTKLFNQNNNLFTTAIIEKQATEQDISSRLYSIGTIQNIHYTPNIISFDTKNRGEGFLLITDSYYPTWHATIDGLETTIYRTDYTFRGIFIPKGAHHIVFYDSLL